MQYRRADASGIVDRERRRRDRGKYFGRRRMHLSAGGGAFAPVSIAGVERPLRELKAFERLHLQPGERRTLHFGLGFRELSFLNADLTSRLGMTRMPPVTPALR
jgi:hypothetical protein